MSDLYKRKLRKRSHSMITDHSPIFNEALRTATETADATPAKRRRGRPKKLPDFQDQQQQACVVATEPKRQRGRPKKQATAPLLSAPEVKQQLPKGNKHQEKRQSKKTWRRCDKDCVYCNNPPCRSCKNCLWKQKCLKRWGILRFFDYLSFLSPVLRIRIGFVGLNWVQEVKKLLTKIDKSEEIWHFEMLDVLIWGWKLWSLEYPFIKVYG